VALGVFGGASSGEFDTLERCQSDLQRRKVMTNELLEAVERSKEIFEDIHEIWGERMEGTGTEGLIREHIQQLNALLAKAKDGVHE
jgi:hypothetical protein